MLLVILLWGSCSINILRIGLYHNNYPFKFSIQTRFITLLPVVISSLTLQNTGIPDVSTNPCVIIGCGVNGYNAIIALALVFLIIATSVVNTNDFIFSPKTFIH